MNIVSTLRWRLRRVMRQIWVRVTAFGLLAVSTALLGAGLAPVVPESLELKIGADSVEPILTILASSMLTVTTFSLSIWVGAFGTAQGSATPRAIRLMQSDRTTQNVLATFIGAFVFALVGIIALETGIYGAGGRVILFAVTLLVIAGIVGSLLRWVQHLSEFGRLGDIISRVERAAAEALQARCAHPWLGGRDWQEPPAGVWAVRPERTGHVQHADPEKLQRLAQTHDCRLWLVAAPGCFVHPAADLVLCDALPADAQTRRALEQGLREAFSIDHARDFDQDPRFGLIALAEIASRALSPGINDPGTGIDILGRLLRVLAEWSPPDRPQGRYNRLHVKPVPPAALIEDAFRAIGRDGAGQIEVARRLQQVLAALAALHDDFLRPAACEALRAAAHAEAALVIASDRAEIGAMAGELAQRAGLDPVARPG